MYIKKVKKNNGRSKKSYEYLHLVESTRTEKGPRQKLILNLGKIDLDPSLYKALSLRIENILAYQSPLPIKGNKVADEINDRIEAIAQVAVKSILLKREKESSPTNNINFKNIDINSIENSNCRTIGTEKVINKVWKELDLDNFFLNEDKVTKSSLSIFKALIFSRLIHPSSELGTKRWAEECSAIYELVGAPLRPSLNSYYRSGDLLYSLKDKLEKHLINKEESLFGSSQIILYDLTNTYLEGRALKNGQAKYGRSKEKRSDCPLLTLGLIIDSNGFVKASKFFDGNQSEPKTLEIMIEELDLSQPFLSKSSKTIVMDAGIATKENIDFLIKKGLNYIVVHRGKSPIELNFNEMEIIREDENKGIKIEVKKGLVNKESFILCRSEKKQEKEKSMRTKQEDSFIEKLTLYNKNLLKPKSIKKYAKILEIVAKLKQKYPKANSLYDIEIITNSSDPKASAVVKEIRVIKKEIKMKEKLSKEGVYFLRTNRVELAAKEVFEIYTTLTRIEDSFRAMKSHLGFRPIFHQLEGSSNSHLFISVIAYHLMNIILLKLRKEKIYYNWNSVRNILSTNMRITTSYIEKLENGELQKQHIRLDSVLEAEQIKIFRALNIKT